MIERIWPGDGSWAGPCFVAFSTDPHGNVMVNLPGTANGGRAIDGSGRFDVVMPLALLRWVIEQADR